MSSVKYFIHKVYHWIESGIAKVFGENARYAFIYFLRTGKLLNLQHPTDMNEKQFWLARYWRHPLKTMCADKYKVREYLEQKGCADVLNELYGVYDRGEDIDFEKLPNKFVIKCNHGCGFNIICEDKSTLDKEAVVKQLNKWLAFQFGRGIENQYSNIERKIVVEKYLEGINGQMIEYQLFCFNGQPMFFLVRNDLRKSEADKTAQTFAISYDIDWNRVYYRKDEEQCQVVLPKPVNYAKMVEYAEVLSADFPHVRVDFYEVDDCLVFGELTFSSHGGVLSNYKQEVVDKFGALLTLPQPYNK